MRPGFRFWWQQIKRRRVAIGVVGIVLVVLVALIIAVHWFGWDWTGFTSATGPTLKPNEQYRPAKTLWDWLQLLIVPLVLAVAALLFNLATTHTEQKIALDKQREDLLQIYLDCMAELLLKEKLRSSAVDAEARNLARVRTITILFQLDARRIGYVFAFLREAGLMSPIPNSSIVSLSGADLRKINLSQADLYKADLSGADLSGADLSGADLSGVILLEANLSGANLSKADLWNAGLSNTDLSNADLSGASLVVADLSNADLSGANLSKAELWRANLSEADLSGACLKGATGITIEELKKQAKSLVGAITSDGSKHPW